MAGTVRYYASVPSPGDLCCIVAKIDLEEVQDSSAKSDFHWKTMKCRLIINTMKDAVIASPMTANNSSVYVIVGVEFFKTRVLQSCLKEINMTWSMPRPVTPDVYVNCLRYSMIFALAPRWNRVGNFLISNKEFLEVEKNTAMRFDLNFAPSCDKNIEACLMLQPLNVRLNELTLEKLGLPEEIIARFMADPDGFIDIEHFGNHRITVLPSLKRGKLMAALKKIPLSSKFNNYVELRRHWKNMYGYRLPETDNGLMYYVVYFPMPMNDHFLYPNICVRHQIQESPYFGNRDLFHQSFLRDIRETLPLICGESLRFVSEERKVEDSSIVAVSTSLEAKRGTVNDEKPLETPEPMRNAATIDGPSTTRLSLSCLTPKNRQLDRAPSTLMSPTPSLRGALSDDEARSDKLRGILTTITRFREAASSTRFSRNKDNPAETQNRCPNVGETDDKMDIDSNEPLVFMPRSNFVADASQCEKKPILGSFCNPTPGPSTSGRCNKNAEARKIIEDSDIVSKYFHDPDKLKKRSDSSTSQDSGKGTLREKLLRNLTKYDEKMYDE